MLVTGITVTTLLTCVATASAQNFFEALFGRLWASPATNADPTPPSSSPESAHSEEGVVYCVRLCDGRYFPVQRHSGVSPAQTCSSFCPASATKIYNGNSINHALATDGKRCSEARLAKLGILDEVKEKTRYATLAAGGELVAKGEVDLGFFNLSEIPKGVTVLARCPTRCKAIRFMRRPWCGRAAGPKPSWHS
jgi:hypothetical protein